MTKLYTVHVKPGSQKGPLVLVGADDELVVYLRERAVESKANEALIALLAKHFDFAKSRLRIVRGQNDLGSPVLSR